MKSAIDLAEKGQLPDPIIRFAMNSLLCGRMLQQRFGQNKQNVIKELSQGRVAIHTDIANEQHYEIPARFFELVLGPQAKYSCCYWDSTTTRLDQAEEAALRISAERAEIRDGMRILDLGCGWGSFSLWLAKKFPNALITSLSNSKLQGKFIKQRAAELALPNLKVTTADIAEFKSSSNFDRVVSIEAFEHLRNYKEIFYRLSKWLTKDGKFFAHIFCHKKYPYLFETTGQTNWMGRYFFTGGTMPSEDLFSLFDEHLKLTGQWRWNGTHYSRTLEAWLSRQDANKAEILELFKEVYGEDSNHIWFNRWRMFFMACSQLFSFRGGDEWLVSHYLFEQQQISI